MNWELITLLTGVMLFAYWSNYAMGSPLADDVSKIDVRAILFWIPNALAIWRLHRLDIYTKRKRALVQDLAVTKDPVVRRGLETDNKRDIYTAGREFFSWEKSFLCPVCFHWWLTLIIGVVLVWLDIFHARSDLFVIAFVYLVNHLLIRKIL